MTEEKKTVDDSLKVEWNNEIAENRETNKCIVSIFCTCLMCV